MSKTYIQEVLSTREKGEEILRTDALPNGIWHVQSSLGHYIVKHGSSYLSDHLQLDETVLWIDEASASIKAAREDLHHVSWSDFISFVQVGHLSELLEEYTEQQLSQTWKEFKELRALHLINYTPQGVLVEAIDASCADPWGGLDYTKSMPSPKLNCVAFRGHDELGWPMSFLRKLFEFGKGKNKEGFPSQAL